MIDYLAILLVGIGMVLLFGGATLSVYSVGLLGLLVGGGGGYLIAPAIGTLVGVDGYMAIAVAILIGGAIGLVATYALLSMAIAAVSFVIGGFLGLVVFAPLLVDGLWILDWGVALGSGIIAAFLGLIMTKTTMILLTSFVGASLTSGAITIGDFEAAQTAISLDPLVFDVTAPLVVGLFVLGILSQFGLFKFGYVTRLVRWLPGSLVFRDRRRTPKSN